MPAERPEMGNGYAANAHEVAWAMQQVETRITYSYTQGAWVLVLQRHCRLSCGSFPLREESNALIERCPYII
jgi:hypothetical protein